MLGELEALAKDPGSDPTPQVVPSDSPAVVDQNYVVVIDRQRGAGPFVFLRPGKLGAAAAGRGLEHEQLIRLKHLEHDLLRSDPEVRIDRAPTGGANDQSTSPVSPSKASNSRTPR